jgi:hypothetical protein
VSAERRDDLAPDRVTAIGSLVISGELDFANLARCRIPSTIWEEL